LILADGGVNGHTLANTDYAAFALVLSQTNTNLARLTQSH